ncbi:unnamed protein product [Dicrocoelium dendriticum]|nr:unnamed protein product [Dicrocoelium dendriticum]
MYMFYAPPLGSNATATQTDSRNICFPLELRVDLFDECRAQKYVHVVARWLAGVAATTMLPAVALGVLTNTVLLCCLLCKIHRPHGLEVFGCFMAFIDGGFLMWTGAYFSLLLFGPPWWGDRFESPITGSHVMCKSCMFITDFLLSARLNLPMCAVLHELRCVDSEPNRKYPKLYAFAKCAFALGLSVIIAGPGGIIYGVWEQSNIYICHMDPQWGLVYHKFYRLHSLLFSCGFIQTLCSLALLHMLWYRMKYVRHTKKLLRTVPAGVDPISLIIFGLDYKVSDSLRNYRILFSQTIIVVGCRILLCVTRIVLSFFTPLEADASRIDSAAMEVIWNSSQFFEIVTACFPFVMWYTNLPEMQWRQLKCCKPYRGPRSVREVRGTDYSQFSLFTTEDAATYEATCIKVMQTLKRHENELIKVHSQ